MAAVFTWLMKEKSQYAQILFCRLESTFTGLSSALPFLAPNASVLGKRMFMGPLAIRPRLFFFFFFVMKISQPICFSNCRAVLVGISLADRLQGALRTHLVLISCMLYNTAHFHTLL